jgi:UDP-N-acetylmuramate--alanine ligase
MSALGKLLHQSGYEVSGSDLRGGAELEALADLGLAVWHGHDASRLEGVELVVASSAVPADDPELTEARSRGLTVWYRPDLLEEISNNLVTIGPTGTHGKTTSSAMLAVGLRAAGRDPSFVVGGELVDLGTNGHRGADDLLVLEVDEAFGTFHRIHLRGLIVTNVEPEHLDHFQTPALLQAAFEQVAGQVEGPVLAGADDPGSASLAAAGGHLTFGLDPSADWRIVDLVPEPGGVRFRLQGRGAEVGVEVPRPGEHVARNAAGVLALLAELGVDLEAAADGLAGFHGVRRRFENRGQVAGVTLIDDYAHHPSEIAATIGAARAAGHRRVWAVFQPHLYTRTELLHRRFGESLAGADRVVVTDVYAAREAPIPGVTGRLVAEAADEAGAEVAYVPHLADLAGFLAARVEPGDLVLTMGAGDITTVPAELATLLDRDPGDG